MLMIRLARRGKKNQPFFRITVSEKTRDTFGKATEIIGYYNPISKIKELKVSAERVAYWISKGAQLSPTVRNLFISNKIIEGEKVNKKQSKKKD